MGNQQQILTKEINHINEVIDISIASGSTFSQLKLAIYTFKNAIGDARRDEMNNPRPMCSNVIDELHKQQESWTFLPHHTPCLRKVCAACLSGTVQKSLNSTFKRQASPSVGFNHYRQ